MSDWFNDLGAVEWFRDQFDPDTVTAWSIFRLMLLSWVFAAVAFIGLDRLSTALLGRSQPLAQEPPVRARTWRWGRKTPPRNYSLMPPGTTVESEVPFIAAPFPLERPLALEAGEMRVRLPDPALPLGDDDFWRLFADDTAPVFGFENGTRLGKGAAPERYNPITGRVESLERNERAGTLSWAWAPDDPHVVGPE
jgi:hypothetical protein